MILENKGPRIEMKEISDFESRWGIVLPDSYRNFLLLNNGGVPTPDTIEILNLLNSPTDVQVFFGIGRSVESSDLSWNMELINERCPELNVLPIACDSGGGIFCLQMEGSAAGGILYCDIESPNYDIYFVALNFEGFLEGIK